MSTTQFGAKLASSIGRLAGFSRTFRAASSSIGPPWLQSSHQQRRYFSSPPTSHTDSSSSGGGNQRKKTTAFLAAAVAAAASTVVAIDTVERKNRLKQSDVSTVAAATANSERRRLNWRQRRFLRFASFEYNGAAYLSPQDFLAAVTPADTTNSAGSSGKPAKPRRRRHVLSDADFRSMLRATPGKRRHSSDHLLRDLGSNGLISYPEFLLLLNVLAKSSYGFRVAFRAFDRNSDGSLDVEEFRRLYRVVSGSADHAADDAVDLLTYNEATADTSLLVHFFGHNGRETVSAEEFARFADNLQREVLLVEFHRVAGPAVAARGASAVMSPSDFGQAVLRRTRLPAAERAIRLALLEDRVFPTDGVTADEYVQFFQFLLHTDDLFFALRMFDIAGKSIDQEDFQRAVLAATGQSVPPKLLSMLFALFDIDGDGALSYAEFLSLFGHGGRTLVVSSDDAAGDDGSGAGETAWERYRKCVRKRMLLHQ